MRVGLQAGWPPGEMDRGANGVVPHGQARSRPCDSRGIGSRRQRQDVGARVHTIANLGAYPSLFWSLPSRPTSMGLCSRVSTTFLCSTLKSTGSTTTVSVDAVRGAGRPEATFVIERIAEKGARETGADLAEFRRRNFITKFPHQTPVIMCYDAGDYGAALDRALELADYKGLGARKAASAAKGKLRGIGFSAYIEACGLAPSSASVGSLRTSAPNGRLAEVRVNPTGSVEVLTGSHSHGQGHETTFAQLVSSRLGIPMENVSVIHGDTDKVQFGWGTYGSRSGAVGMSALSRALDKIEAKAKKVAGHVLDPLRATSSSRRAVSRSRVRTSRSSSAQLPCTLILGTSSTRRSWSRG